MQIRQEIIYFQWGMAVDVEMKVGRLGDIVNMHSEGEGVVKDDSRTLDLRGGWNNGTNFDLSQTVGIDVGGSEAVGLEEI